MNSDVSFLYNFSFFTSFDVNKESQDDKFWQWIPETVAKIVYLIYIGQKV